MTTAEQALPVAAVKPDPQEILRALRLLHDPREIIEVRAPKTRRGTVSGYYDGTHWEELARDVAGLDCPQVQPPAIYVTLNPVNPDVKARAVNRLEHFAISTTTDAEITSRRLLLVDADSVRPKGVSATDAEHSAGTRTVTAIRAYLHDQGWPDPVLADSGNGGHLQYRVDLPNNAVAEALLRDALRALARRFDSAQVQIDASTFNASRICKLYGTVARKGDHTPERPHRLARILEAPGALQPVPRELLEALASGARPVSPPPSPRPAAVSNGRGDYTTLDVVRWFHAHGAYGKPLGDGKHSCLCLWESEHSSGDGATDSDSVIWEADGNGVWPQFHCAHAHCEGKGIEDVMHLWGDADGFCARDWVPPHPAAGDESPVVAVAEDGQEGARAQRIEAAVATGTVEATFGVVDALAMLPTAEYAVARHRIKQGCPDVTLGLLDAAVAERRPAGDGADAGRHQPSQTDILLSLAEEATLFHTPGGDPEGFAVVPVGGHRETWPLQSEGFSAWLRHRYLTETGRGVNAQSLADARATIAARAQFEAPEAALFTRIGFAPGVVYLDLGDPEWRCVEITATGWRVLSEAPVRFRRRRGLLPLPMPVAGGSLDELRDVVNLAEDDQWRLAVGWLIGSFRPRGPYLVLCIHGEQGSAKSYTANKLRAVVDPNVAPLRAAPREIRDLSIAAQNAWVVGFDNLSTIPGWLSDAICRLATGAGFSTRGMYTNDEEKLFDCQRPVILTGIEEVATQGDMQDRAITLMLKHIPKGKRQPEKVLDARFAAMHGRLLGAALDAVSGAIRCEDSINLRELPRMADATIWVTAAEDVLGWEPGAFLRSYDINRDSASGTVLGSDPIGPIFLTLGRQPKPWSGTATELLQALRSGVTEKEYQQRAWPQTPRGTSGRLRRLAPALRASGVGVEFWETTDRDHRLMIDIGGIEDVGARRAERAERADSRMAPALSPTPQRADDVPTSRERADGKPSAAPPSEGSARSARPNRTSSHREVVDAADQPWGPVPTRAPAHVEVEL